MTIHVHTINRRLHVAAARQHNLRTAGRITRQTTPPDNTRRR